jgi:ferredoxin-NADP reductase
VGTVLGRLALAAAADLTGRAHDAMSLRVERIELAADNIRLLTLVDSGGAALPEWEPGAHLELHLPSLRVADGRGGSIEVHDTALEGRMLTVRAPINRFRLVDASCYDQSFAL